MRAKHSADYLRKPAEAFEPDPRTAAFQVYESETGKFREPTLDDQYAFVSELDLGDSVPEEVPRSFETAKNLLLYSWFVYSFMPLAELQAYAALEAALRHRLGVRLRRRPPSLSNLLEQAVKRGWICDEGFRRFKRGQPLDGDTAPAEPLEFTRALCQSIPLFRNQHAHGELAISPYGAFVTLEIVCDLLNQLFEA